MLLRKTGKLWQIGLLETRRLKRKFHILMLFIFLGITGCSNKPEKVLVTIVDDDETESLEKNIQIEEENIADIFLDIYSEAIAKNTFSDLEVMQRIIECLGENGYVAVDNENQVDMTESYKVIQFSEKVDSAEEAELTIIVVSYSGGFTKYDFKTVGGIVDIVREYYQYFDDHVEHRSTGTYRADSWQYTEEGYLLFSGHWFSEQFFTLVASDIPEYVGLRVQPLDDKCREFNRRYILPIGYGKNNMFIENWNEDDYGELDFCDLFDIFYPFIYGQRNPYVMDKNLEVGVVHRIPKEEFETVIMAYFNIDSKALQLNTKYYPEDATYEYRPRGFYEIEYPDAIPFSEVVNYVENSDGTVKLTVHPVLPEENTSKVYTHEVVIRPLADGGVQYVSNHIITSDENYEQIWHVPRLTEEEWEEVYGDIK